jgi:hypothetical protein
MANIKYRGLGCNKRVLLNHLMIKLHQVDLNALVGHNILGFDLVV